MIPPDWLTIHEDGISIALYVQPGAKRTAPAGLHDGVPKVRLAAPARDGEANRELTRWFSKTLGVARSAVTITSGTRSRRKRLKIEGPPGDLAARALRVLGS